MTTDQIPLSDLGSNAGDDGLRRDQWGRLLVVPPEGDKPEGYTRVTTVAKTTDEGGGLGPWKATCAVVGTMKRRGIRAKWEALISATGGDPWYYDEESKAKAKRLVEEAAEAGGATDRREQGTALHAITAQLDRGEQPVHLSDETKADLAAYRAEMAKYGVEIVDNMVEITVVLDEWKVAGSFDRLVRVRGRDLPLIADLKTGADLTYSWQSFEVQLAAYSRGNDIYLQGPISTDDERFPMPDVSQTEGLIIWLPAGEARCELHLVDLTRGWEGFELSMAVRGYRKVAGKAHRPLDVWEPAPLRVIDTALRAWLQERIDVIGKHPEARADLLQRWPEGMPSLKASDAHTNEDLDEIEDLVSMVEGQAEIPFGPARPREAHLRDAIRRVGAAFPGATLHTSKQQAKGNKP